MDYSFEVEKKMFESIKSKNYEEVKDLLSKGYDINHQNLYGFWENMLENEDYRKCYQKTDHFQEGEGDKNTPLHTAVAYADQEMIYQLFKLGANINVEVSHYKINFRINGNKIQQISVDPTRLNSENK